MSDAARCVRELAAPARAWGRLGFAMGLFGAPVRSMDGGTAPRPAPAFFRQATASLGDGRPGPAEMEARLGAFEDVHRELMAEEMASLRTHYALRTAGLLLDLAVHMSLLGMIVYAAFVGAPLSKLWVAFGFLAAWMGPVKLFASRRLLRREDALRRLTDPVPLPWTVVVDGPAEAEDVAATGRGL